MTRRHPHVRSSLGVCGVWLLVVLVGTSIGSRAQAQGPTPSPASPEADSLGRHSPRGTVLGFLKAARSGDNALAARYLETTASGRDAETLAHQLFVVLDNLLPARLSQVSDEPTGSRPNPLQPDQDVVGTITTGGESIEIVVVRVASKTTGPIWLFSRQTLAAVPRLFESATAQNESLLGRLLPGRGTFGERVLDLLTVLVGVSALYLVTSLLNRVLTPLMAFVWRRKRPDAALTFRDALPLPARLLLVALISRWTLSGVVPMSLLVRQRWSNIATLVTIASIVWLLVHLNGLVERYIQRRIPPPNSAAATSLLRLCRRGADVLVIFGGILATLRLYAIDPTPALAGLGVGGIAVALAAQKTLENVIAGASLIFDQAVRVGDTLKMGEVVGTVDHIGLRSTRIRTQDRTMVSVPNSQIANAILETLSARDKFWFHPIVSLRYETTPEQLRAVVANTEQLLQRNPAVERDSVWVRFVRFGSFSVDVEIFAYLRAAGWNQFLEIQEQLLLSIQEIVSRAGTRLALPSQTLYGVDAQPPTTTADSFAISSPAPSRDGLRADSGMPEEPLG